MAYDDVPHIGLHLDITSYPGLPMVSGISERVNLTALEAGRPEYDLVSWLFFFVALVQKMGGR